MNVFLSTICLLIFISIFQLSCRIASQPKECTDFFETNERQDEKAFAGYDLEKQLIIQTCGLQRHPRSDYSYKIAERGNSIAPILLQKLKSKTYDNKYQEELSEYGIILVLQRLTKYEKLNGEIINVIEQTVSEIKTSWIKEESESALTEIKNSQIQ